VTSPDDATPPIGTGPRLVSPAEFAAVLNVTEEDVRGWLAEESSSPWLLLRC
jgi:hypothetical protein